MLLPLLTITSFLSLTLAKPSAKCRCLSTDPCWPSTDAFAELGSRVSQPLLFPTPPERACYPLDAPSGNCSAVKSNALDGRWRSDQPGSMQASDWEANISANGTIEACYLDTTLAEPCGQGSVPPAGVDARTPGDIQAAVKFAAKYGLRLVVKNTGHDFLGRSTGRGGFLVWTHHMKNITFHDEFTPIGGPESENYQAVTLGAGVQWYEAYSAANATGRVVVGGITPRGSVGSSGGWIQGGGHSVLSPTYGLGVDNVLQFTIVTASGDHLTVNAYQHAQLFWALRGGGGGTWGIVTSVTYRTHPITPFTGAFLVVNSTTRASYRPLVAEVLRHAPRLADAGWGAYASSLPGENQLRVTYGGSTDGAHANATIEPLFALARALANQDVQVQTSVIPFDSFYAWFAFLFSSRESAQTGLNGEISNRLISREMLEDEAEGIADAILENNLVMWNQIAGGAVNRFDKDSTGLNPAWRDAVVQVMSGIQWLEGASVEYIQAQRTSLKEQTDLFSSFSNAAYYNEAMLYEDDFKTTFFGDHYDELKRIKRDYDPEDLFIVTKGVGSEDWDDDLVCRK